MVMPVENRIIVKGMHTPIIDEETFNTVQELLKSRTNVRVKKHDWLLKGILVCHECGKKIGLIPQRMPQKTVFYIRCNTYATNPSLRLCEPHTNNLEKITEIVISKIRKNCEEFLENDKRYNLTTKLKKEFSNNKQNIKNELLILTKNIKEINKTIDTLFKDKSKGLLEDEDFRRIYSTQLELRKKSETRIETLKKAQEKDSKLTDINKLATDFLNSKEITKPQLLSLVEKVEISALKEVTITYKFNILNTEKLKKVV